jgi:isoquinoline 1-oxidoreductase beta subunit
MPSAREDTTRWPSPSKFPAVETHLVRSGEVPGGIGEAPTCAVGPAVTNTIFAATGKRVRTLPIGTGLLKSSG